jgi:hypothetical protein
MTIFTRPQWCIEPLRPHPRAVARGAGSGLEIVAPPQESSSGQAPVLRRPFLTRPESRTVVRPAP